MKKKLAMLLAATMLVTLFTAVEQAVKKIRRTESLYLGRHVPRRF